MINTFDLVLFGGTGDLSTRKLIPALFRQETASSLDDDSNIIGVGTKDLSQEDYLNVVKVSLDTHFPGFASHYDSWDKFKKRITYYKLDITSEEDWENFKQTDKDRVTVFYLAIPPSLYKDISQKLNDNNLITPNSRIVVEKPIGTDRESANNINKYLSLGFKENQIYRIDHYLGKEAVQNLLALRFANTIFEQSWSSSAIDHIQISVAEDLGVEGRGGYYDKTGALRDMIQNHLLQILCLIAMEPPVSISSESVRDEKLKVLKSLAFFDENSIKSDSVRARYTEGLSKGMAACSYVDEDGVDSDNKTETFVALKVLINNWRWSGVPFT